MVAGVVGYNIYRKVGAQVVTLIVSASGATSFTDETALNGVHTYSASPTIMTILLRVAPSTAMAIATVQ